MTEPQPLSSTLPQPMPVSLQANPYASYALPVQPTRIDLRTGMDMSYENSVVAITNTIHQEGVAGWLGEYGYKPDPSLTPVQQEAAMKSFAAETLGVKMDSSASGFTSQDLFNAEVDLGTVSDAPFANKPTPMNTAYTNGAPAPIEAAINGAISAHSKQMMQDAASRVPETPVVSKDVDELMALSGFQFDPAQKSPAAQETQMKEFAAKTFGVEMSSGDRFTSGDLRGVVVAVEWGNQNSSMEQTLAAERSMAAVNALEAKEHTDPAGAPPVSLEPAESPANQLQSSREAPTTNDRFALMLQGVDLSGMKSLAVDTSTNQQVAAPNVPNVQPPSPSAGMAL